MIVFEDAIEALVSQIPAVGGFSANFGWGDQNELNRYIAVKGQPYPIIWLEVSKELHDTQEEEITRDCRFIIAVRETKTDRLNDVRLRNSFDNFLIPLANRLIEGLKKNSRTSLPDRSYEVFKFPNYSESGKNKTIDLWDAITINCKVLLNNNCQNTIKWQSE